MTQQPSTSRCAANARVTPLGLVVSAVLVATAGCAGHGSHPVSDPPTAPRGNVYAPPSPLPAGAPGALIWAQRLTDPPLNPPATIWRILYHSRDAHGDDVAVSGFALVPEDHHHGARPVYAWAHGTAGQGDQCAPSRDIAPNLPPYGGQQVQQHALVVATDYDGLGTPGEPTYLAGAAEGRAVLDSIRAAAQLPDAGPLGPVVLAGQSQGGGATLWAGELAHTYAPSLTIRGLVAIAPAADFPVIMKALHRPPYAAFLGSVVLAADGLHAAYGAAFSPAQFLTRPAAANIAAAQHECAYSVIARWQHQPYGAAIRQDPFGVPALASVLRAIEPQPSLSLPPVLLVQGTNDEQVPPQVTADLLRRYCESGVSVTRKLYPGASHDGVVDVATTDVTSWITQRYNDQSTGAKSRSTTSSC